MKYTKKTRFLLKTSINLSIFAIFVTPLLVAKLVNAADAGCYLSGKTSNGSGTTTTIRSVTCPDAQKTAVQGGKCFVAIVGTQGQGPFEEKNCDSFEVGSKTEALPENETETTSERCQNVEPGSPEANGCAFFQPQFESAVNAEGKYQCGKGRKAVKVGFNFGCRGEDYPEDNLNPIVDIALAIFRFLSVGVGIVVIGSIVVAGIQYSASRGNPQSTQAAINRVGSSFIALLIYLFSFAIANFLVPGGMFL